MGKQTATRSFYFQLLFILLCFASTSFVSAGKVGKHKALPGKKLFVFGDSYSDTGNWKKETGLSWKPPYGSTFPGKPAGRFSDGRIITDFLASYLGIGSPVPYEQRRWAGAARGLRFGVNFAYGGTGVFDTDVSLPNMTTQIDFFQNLLEAERAYTRQDLESSVALVTLGGNDYAHFLKNGSLQDIRGFMRSVVKQLASDLDRIHSLGVSKIAVAGMEPAGCLPAFSIFTSYQNCSDTLNAYARFHNRILHHAVRELNNKTRHPPAFFFLDLYGAFMSALNNPNGELEHESALKPCCEGVSIDYSCGSKEGNEAKYTVCSNPEAAFFWDSAHPAQHGWYQVFLYLQSSLKPLA